MSGKRRMSATLWVDEAEQLTDDARTAIADLADVMLTTGGYVGFSLLARNTKLMCQWKVGDHGNKDFCTSPANARALAVQILDQVLDGS